MAKSQYTDSIIQSNILYNIRVDNKGRILDLANYNNSSFWYNLELNSTYTKFSSKSIFPKDFINFQKNYYNSFNNKSWTASFWCNPYNIPSHGASWQDGFILGLYFETDSAYIYFAVDEANSGTNAYTHLRLRRKSDDVQLMTANRSSGMVSQKVWHHYAVTYNGSTYKMYEDGTQIISVNSTSTLGSTLNYLQIIGSNSTYGIVGYFDDVVLIHNQVLWTGNFTPPNYYLTGDITTKRLSNKKVLYPVNRLKGDYFDKAYLY